MSQFTSQLRLRTQACRTTLNSCGCLGCWWLRKRMPVSSSTLTKPGWDAGRDRHPCAVVEEEAAAAVLWEYSKIQQNYLAAIIYIAAMRRKMHINLCTKNEHLCNYSNPSSSYNVWWACCKLALSTPLTSHISPLCVAELLALMVRPSPSRSLSPGIVAPIWVEGDGDGGCSASVQNNVRGPWSSQKWQRATRAFICNANKKFNEHCCISCIAFSVISVIINFCSVITR